MDSNGSFTQEQIESYYEGHYCLNNSKEDKKLDPIEEKKIRSHSEKSSGSYKHIQVDLNMVQHHVSKHKSSSGNVSFKERGHAIKGAVAKQDSILDEARYENEAKNATNDQQIFACMVDNSDLNEQIHDINKPNKHGDKDACFEMPRFSRKDMHTDGGLANFGQVDIINDWVINSSAIPETHNIDTPFKEKFVEAQSYSNEAASIIIDGKNSEAIFFKDIQYNVESSNKYKAEAMEVLYTEESEDEFEMTSMNDWIWNTELEHGKILSINDLEDFDNTYEYVESFEILENAYECNKD